MSVPKLVRKFLCYDLEACFVQKGCKRGETKILEVAFKTENLSYQCLVNPLKHYQSGKEVIQSLDSMKQHVDNTLNFWTKLLIGKKALPSSLKRKPSIEKAKQISMLLKRSDVAMQYNKHVANNMMQALARHDDDEEKAKNDIRKNEDSFDQLFYTPDEAIKGMLKEAKGIDIWVAHNGKSFDEKVLRGHDHDFDHVIFVDSLHLLKYLVPGMPSYSQPLLYQQLFTKKYFAHHALEDSIALHKIMNHALGEKCILETYQSTVEKREKKRAGKKKIKYPKVHPESTLYNLNGIGAKSVEKLYKKDIKTRDELIGLINSIDYEAWCDNYSFVHHYKKIYHTYKGASSNAAVV